MAHKTLVNGTSYEVSGGKTLLNGTGYSIKGGRTLVGGTGYDISFAPPQFIIYDGEAALENENTEFRVRIISIAVDASTGGFRNESTIETQRPEQYFEYTLDELACVYSSGYIYLANEHHSVRVSDPDWEEEMGLFGILLIKNVDLTEYSTLHVIGYSTDGDYGGKFGYTDSIIDLDDTSTQVAYTRYIESNTIKCTSVETEFTLDISSVSGSHHIMLSAEDYRNGGNATYISKIWLT